MADPIVEQVAAQLAALRWDVDANRTEREIVNAAASSVVALVGESWAAEFDRMSSYRMPGLDPKINRAISGTYADCAERIRHPEKFGGVAARDVSR